MFIIVFIVLLSCINPSFSQDAQYRYKVYGITDGLSQSSVYSLFQDSQGFIWVGTADGLNRFDGYNFKVFRHDYSNQNSLPDNNIRRINEINDSLLIIVADGAYCIYNRKSGNFLTNPFEPSKLNKIYACKIFIENNIVWISYYYRMHDLRKYDLKGKTSKLIQTLFSNNVEYYYRFIDPSESGRFKQIVEKSNGILLDAVTQLKKKIHHDLNGNAILNTILIDKRNNVWLGTKYGLFVCKNRNLYKCKIKEQEGSILFSYLVEALCEDQNGDIWAGTENNGLYKINPDEQSFSQIDLKDKETSLLVKINCLLIDKSGMVWIGTDNGNGLIKINPNKPKFSLMEFSDKNSLNKKTFIRGMAEDSSGNIWIGTDGKGLIQFNPRNFSYIIHKHNGRNSIGSNDIYAVFYDYNNNIWIGSKKSLDKFNLKRNKFTHFDLPEVKWISEEKDSILLFANSDGMFDNEKNENKINKFITKDRFNLNTFLYSGDNILWEGTYGKGLLKVNTKTNEIIQYKFDPNNSLSISNDRIQDIFPDPKDKNIIWVGTHDGLNKFYIKEGKFYHYNETSGLPSNYIYGILNDNKDNFWISTNKGLTKFNPSKNTFRNYTLDDNLQSYEFNSGAFLKTRNGLMLFGGINGLNIFYPDSVLDNPHVPNVVLTGIEKFDIPVKTTKDFSLIKQIHFNYDESVFSFAFSALEFSNPDQNKYAYKLDGFEKNWIYNDTRREARYTHLNPGTYTFLVKAANNDGVWTKKPLAIKVIIEPPFWQTWWFRIIAVTFSLALMLTVFGFIFTNNYRKKLKDLKEQQVILNEKSRISRDMHDEVGAALTKISILSAMNGKDYNKENGSQIKSINRAANEAINKLDEIVWAVNPSNDNLKNLVAYISEYAENFFESSPIRCRFDFPSSVPEINISAEVRHEVFLVVKEILTNIQKYSNASFAYIKLAVIEGKICFIIEDDGKGFDVQKIMETSNGIENMKFRIKSIGGVIKITSEIGKGSRTEVSFYPD